MCDTTTSPDARSSAQLLGPAVEMLDADTATKQRQVFDAVEYGVVEVSLSDIVSGGTVDLYPEIAEKDCFSISLRRGALVLQARGYVGLIPINDAVAVDVHPRVPISSLARMIEIGDGSPVSLRGLIRRYGTTPEGSPSLLDAYAESLLGDIDTIAARGGHHQYVRERGDASFPKGGVPFGRSMERHLARGKRHEVTASWFRLSAVTGPNRCLNYAIWFRGQRYCIMKPRKGSRRILSGLNRAFHLFKGVELDKSRQFLSDPIVADPDRLPAQYVHYGDALRLAKAIINERGIAFMGRGGELKLASLLIRMEDLFEAYLRNHLRRGMARLDPAIRVLDGNKGGPDGGRRPLFSSGRDTPAQPDIVLSRKLPEGREETPLLVEVKYGVREFPSRENLNQAIAYGIAYDCPSVVIALPRSGGVAGLHRIGTVSRMTLYRYVFDLDAEHLEDEEAAFAEAVHRLVANAATSQPRC